MQHQNLFIALQEVCGFTALESDMLEILAAVEKDNQQTPPGALHLKGDTVLNFILENWMGLPLNKEMVIQTFANGQFLYFYYDILTGGIFRKAPLAGYNKLLIELGDRIQHYAIRPHDSLTVTTSNNSQHQDAQLLCP